MSKGQRKNKNANYTNKKKNNMKDKIELFLAFRRKTKNAGLPNLTTRLEVKHS